ncbi:hypothetical protein A9R01_09280 ['Osedax' symbiont bacterium Rs2_46_30_T18]|nr:hypothetical protein A9R01_09280 ['Osedax' symbiont bacterium Rs2_46_30_T18]
MLIKAKYAKYRSLVLSLLLILVVVVPGEAVSAAQSVAGKKAEVKQLQAVLKKLQSDLKKERAKRSKEERALQLSEQNIATTAAQILELNKKLASNNSNLQGFLSRQTQLQQQLDLQQNNLVSIIKQRYQMGEETPLKLLLRQQNPEYVSRMLIYFEKIREQQNTEILAFRQLLAKHDSNNSKIDQTQSQLLTQRKKLQQQQQQLQSSRTKRRQVLAKIDLQISKNRTKIKKLAADKKRLEKVISRIQKVLPKTVVKVKATVKAKVKDNRPFKVLKGKLPWPVKGRVIRNFASVENNLAYDGVLISAVQGRSVQAVHGGMVVFADWLRSYGMLMIIDHGDGYLTLYGHNQQLLKKVGDSVSTQEPIAMTGNSGGSQHAALYFAIRHRGQTTNPRAWFARR